MAMMAGMLPIALGWGAEASFRQPMAVAVIGGLFTSTALSLLVVPVVYTYVDAIEKFFVRIWSHGPFHNRGAALRHGR
jgi:Cu/Ag efflux pump CusA